MKKPYGLTVFDYLFFVFFLRKISVETEIGQAIYTLW